MKMIFELILIGLISSAVGDLQHDFEDILNVIPFKEIEEIADNHNHHDPEYREVVEYMRGSEWKDMLHQVNQQAAFKTLEGYLYNIGLDIQKIINAIQKFIDDMKHRSYPTRNTVLIVEQESLRSFLDEVEEIIPKQKILAIVLYKLRNSPDFKRFYNDLSSEQTHKLVEQTKKLTAVQELIAKLEHMGVRVNDTIAVIYALLGWQIPQ